MYPSQLCSVSIDVDTLRFYRDIHGLPPEPLGEDPIYSHAMPRILRFLREMGIRATFFLIGEDTTIPAHQDILHQLIEEGHEIANHTFRHPYTLTTLSPSKMEEEVALAEEHLAPFLACGQKIYGFRSPGYNTSPELIEILRRRGYRYDSSVFPSVPYYLAKAAIMTWQKLLQRQSRAHLGPFHVLRAPSHPYPMGDHPYRRGPAHATLWQLPIATLPLVQWPFIGTSILLTPAPLLMPITILATQTYPFLNLELHAIDFFDGHNDPNASPLLAHQPDLRISISRKLSRFRQVFKWIRRSHNFLPLCDALPFLQNPSTASIQAEETQTHIPSDVV
ncbi:MAG: polysaccharide deacetylase family protein [Myxococcota bacterium]